MSELEQVVIFLVDPMDTSQDGCYLSCSAYV